MTGLHGLARAGCARVWGRRSLGPGLDLLTLGGAGLGRWVGVLGLGKLVPLLWISFLDTGSGLAVIPALLALLGIALWEHLWVEAPQRLPLA